MLLSKIGGAIIGSLLISTAAAAPNNGELAARAAVDDAYDKRREVETRAPAEQAGCASRPCVLVHRSQLDVPY